MTPSSNGGMQPFTRIAPGQLRNVREGFQRLEEPPPVGTPSRSPVCTPGRSSTASRASVGGDGNGSGKQSKLRDMIRNKAQPQLSARKQQASIEYVQATPEQQFEAASRIQRWYREMLAMYAAFGPMMFACKDGRLADFGSLSFLSGSRSARFIRVADTTSVGLLSHFLEKFWRLPRPDVLLSVTGSAASLQLGPTLQRIFDRGLATAAAMTNAWIFTGGTDSGVMKLVGEAIHKYGLDVPLVGIAPWGAVLGRGHLAGCKGEVVRYRGGSPAVNEARLNPYHTHQILVDACREYDEETSAWGHEIGVRSQLERCYATARGVPVVLLVVQGGPNTLDMMTASAKEGSPLLILSDSGGAATALDQYCKGGISRVSDPVFAGFEDKLEALRAMDAAREGSLMTFFRLSDDDEESMSTALLRCLFRNLMFYQVADAAPAAKLSLGAAQLGKVVDRLQEAASRRRDHMQRALMLAVKWNQVEFAKRMLAELPGTEDYSRPLGKMLQHAFELHRVEIVSLLLDRPGCDMDEISLCHLYLQEDQYNYVRSDAPLQARLRKKLADGTVSRNHSYEAYKEVVGPFLQDVSPLLATTVIEPSRAASHVDVFFWAVFMGNVPLARTIWAHVDNPLHCALLASHIFRTMSKKITWGKHEVSGYAAELEGWAVGVINLVDEQEIAHLILSHNVESWRMGALVELALQMELKNFLAHRHCTSLNDLWWRGGYPGSACAVASDEPLYLTVLYALVPFLNPYLHRVSHDEGSKTLHRSIEEKEEILFSALSHALALAAKARQAAHANERAKPRKSSISGQHAPSNERRRSTNTGKAGGSPLVNKGSGGSGVSPLSLNDAPAAISRQPSAEHASTVHFDPHLDQQTTRRRSVVLGARQRTTKGTLHFNRAKTGRALISKQLEDENRAAASEAAGALGAFTGFYSIPLVKFLMRALWHIAFLAMYVNVITHSPTDEELARIAPAAPPLSHRELLFIPWALGLAFEHRIRHRKLARFGLSMGKVPFQSAVNFGHSLLAFAICVRLLAWLPLPQPMHDAIGYTLGEHNYAFILYHMILSFDAVLLFVELFTFMWTSLRFGVLAIIMGQMLVDLSLFLVFALVLLLGFSAALVGLARIADEPILGAPEPLLARALRVHSGQGHAPTPDEGLPLLALPVWALIADLELEKLMHVPLGLCLMWAYVLLSNVVLVNLLIAMFADTYSRIKENAEVEYHYQRFLHIFEYTHVVPAIPPPFSMPWLLCEMLDDLRAAICGGGGGAPSSAAEALHRVAAARPTLWDAHGVNGSLSLSKKYLQEFLKDESKDGAAQGAVGMMRKVEGLIQALDERVASQLDRMDKQLGGQRAEQMAPGDDELRNAVNTLLARLDRSSASERAKANFGGESTLARAAGSAPRSTAQHLCSIMYGSRDAATGAAPVSRLCEPARGNSSGGFST